jgi:hypothetical protein
LRVLDRADLARLTTSNKETKMKLDKDQILDALGIETDTNWIGIALGGFGVGCLVGAVVALLVTPKSGAELRSDIVDRGRNLMRRGREGMNEINENLKSPSTNPTY